MNVCSRLESSSDRGRIQCSKETADHLTNSGKGAWLQRRTNAIEAKGKGSLETFWVSVHGEQVPSRVSTDGDCVTNDKYGPSNPLLDERTNRLIDWNVEMLLGLLKQIVARRNASESPEKTSSTDKADGALLGATPLEEVREIIALPEFDKKAASKQPRPEEVFIPEIVQHQLHNLVSCIASMYNDNPFHSKSCSVFTWALLFFV